jgi:hypothetical protein
MKNEAVAEGPGRLAFGFLDARVESRATDRAEKRLYLQKVLGLTEAEAGRRYLEAVRRLRAILPWVPASGHS